MDSLDLIFEDDAVSLDLRHRLPTSRAEACRILRKLRAQNGHLSDNGTRELTKVNEEARLEFEQYCRNLRKVKAKFTKKYSKLSSRVIWLLI